MLARVTQAEPTEGARMPEQESHAAESSPAALITAIAALVAALGGIYVAVREPDAEKVSAASEAISKASQDEHDQLVKLIQAVDDLSKNSDQNHDAIEGLQQMEPRLAQVIELHYFGGLTYDQIAEAVGTSAATVHRDIRLARAWLLNEIGGTPSA